MSRWKDLTSEQRERRRENCRRHVAKMRAMTPEERESYRAKQAAERAIRRENAQMEKKLLCEMDRYVNMSVPTNEKLLKYEKFRQAASPGKPVPRPEWCSPARWRMFLQWRRDPRRFICAGEDPRCVSPMDTRSFFGC